MFYILNFANHSFISCDTANEVKDWLQGHIGIDTNAECVEIINGFVDDTRLTVGDFLCNIL